MGRLHVYFGSPCNQKIFDKSPEQLFVAVLVYEQSVSRVGLDFDEFGSALVVELGKSGLHWEAASQTLIRFPDDVETALPLVRRSTTYTLLGSESSLGKCVDEVHKYSMTLKVNRLRKRYGVVAESATAQPWPLAVYSDEQGLLNVDAVSKMHDHGVQLIIKWKCSCYGLHAYGCAIDQDGIDELMVRVHRCQGIAVVVAKSERDIPVW